MAGAQWWGAPTATGPLDAVVSLPGSKSETARAFLLGATSRVPLVIHGPLLSRDTVLACEALEHVGCRFSLGDSHALVVHAPATPQNTGLVNCGLAGTVMRFVPALAAFGEGTVRFDGDPAARARPMRPLLDALTSLGARVTYHGTPGHLPFSITGVGEASLPSRIQLDSSASSQYLSALLLAACAARSPFTIEVTAEPPSAAHVDMTLSMMSDQGVTVDRPGPREYVVGGMRPDGRGIRVEPDLSNAGPFLAAALVCGGTVLVSDWPRDTQQAGDEWRHLLPLFGGECHLDDDGLTVTAAPGTRWPGIDVDLGRVGELAPTVAALCVLADSPSRLRGIGHLRGHETDRLEALATEIQRCGARAEVLSDGLQITPAPLHAARFDSYADHRMATFGALLGLTLPGSSVLDIGTTAKTLPDFVERWEAMLVGAASPAIPSLAKEIAR